MYPSLSAQAQDNHFWVLWRLLVEGHILTLACNNTIIKRKGETSNFGVFVVSVLLSALVERFSVSLKQDFFVEYFDTTFFFSFLAYFSYFGGYSLIQPPKSLSVVRSTVRLRFRKSISGHHFQTIRKLANNDFQYHREVIYST